MLRKLDLKIQKSNFTKFTKKIKNPPTYEDSVFPGDGLVDERDP